MSDSSSKSNPMQPFIDLVQGNMALLAKYATSPEAMSQAMAQLQAAMTQGPGAASQQTQTAANFAELVKGMSDNYMRFMSEITQGGMALFAQSQGAMFQQAQEAAGTLDPEGRSKRGTRS